MNQLNHQMRHTGAMHQLSAWDTYDFFKKDISGNLLLKINPHSEDYVPIKIILENVEVLANNSLQNNTHPNFQRTIESMAEAINHLAEENELLKQKMEEMEMRIGEN